ncbi:hypothetical protein KKC97_10520 [bacterium]|nr:hypothetical protein [bacterium]
MQYIGKDIVTHGSLLHLNRDIAWKELRSRAKQGIRKARKAGIRVEESRDLSQMEKLWYDPETLIKELSEEQTLYLAYLDNELVGGIILTPVTSNTLFYHFGGTNEKGRLIEANAYLFWHAVEQFHDSSFEYLDVGVSYRYELQHFFHKYCTQPYPILFNPMPENVRPKIGIEPFCLTDENISDEPVIAINTRLAEYFESDFTFMPSWPFALQSALRALDLKKNQTIGVWASAGDDSYLSLLKNLFGEQFIFKLRDPDADAYLVAHRWGLICPDSEILALENKPLIEDCRDALEYGNRDLKPGSFGSLVVYDFTRWFPMPFGAILAGRYYTDQEIWNKFHCLDVGKRNAVREALQIHWPRRAEYAAIRNNNCVRFHELFNLLGFQTIPGGSRDDRPVLLLKGSEYYSAEAIHDRLAKFDIRSECDKNDNIIALPCHCRLNRSFVDYIFGAIRGMINPCHTYVRKDPTLEA